MAPALDAFLPELLDQPVGSVLGPTNIRVLSALRQMAAQTFTRSIWWTSRNRCSISSTVPSTGW